MIGFTRKRRFWAVEWQVTCRFPPDDIERTKAEYEREAWDADSVYRIVRLVLTSQWGNFSEMVDALTVLLVTWNDRCYRSAWDVQSERA